MKKIFTILFILLSFQAFSDGLVGKWEIDCSIELGTVQIDFDQEFFSQDIHIQDNPDWTLNINPRLHYYLSNMLAFFVRPVIHLGADQLNNIGFATGVSLTFQLTKEPKLFLSPGIYGSINGSLGRNSQSADPDSAAPLNDKFIFLNFATGLQLRAFYMLGDNFAINATLPYPLLAGSFNKNNIGTFETIEITNRYYVTFLGFSIFL